MVQAGEKKARKFTPGLWYTVPSTSYQLSGVFYCVPTNVRSLAAATAAPSFLVSATKLEIDTRLIRGNVVILSFAFTQEPEHTWYMLVVYRLVHAKYSQVVPRLKFLPFFLVRP